MQLTVPYGFTNVCEVVKGTMTTKNTANTAPMVEIKVFNESRFSETKKNNSKRKILSQILFHKKIAFEPNLSRGQICVSA